MFVDILNAFRRAPVSVNSLVTGAMAGAPCPEELVLALINDLNMKNFLVKLFGTVKSHFGSGGSGEIHTFKVKKCFSKKQI